MIFKLFLTLQQGYLYKLVSRERKDIRFIPCSGKAGRTSLGLTIPCLTSEMCDVHSIHIRDYDSGKMQKNAERM